MKSLSRLRATVLAMVLLTGTLGGPASPTVARGDDADAATRTALRELLLEQWNRGEESQTRAINSILRRATGSNADLALLKYAHGLLLLHQEQMKIAENVFRSAVRHDDEYPEPQLGLAYALIADDKHDAGLRELREAVDLGLRHQPTLDTVAVVVAFLGERPPERLRNGALAELEDRVFPKLPLPQQERYREVQRWTRQYVRKLPELRVELLRGTEPLRRRIAEGDAEVKRLLEQRQELLDRIRLVEAEIARLRTEASGVRLRYDGSIQAALAAGNDALAAQYRVARDRMLRGIDAQVDAATVEYNRLVADVRRLDATLVALQRELQRLGQELAAEEARVDRVLARPPVPLQPALERLRLLAEYKLPAPGPGGAPAAPPMALPPAGEGDADAGGPAQLEGEARAQKLLELANAFRDAGYPGKAAEYYSKLTNEHPRSRAAAAAREAMQTLEVPVDDES